MNEYIVYHDESQVGGFWHGILFIPEKHRTFILESLNEIRTISKFNEPISLKNATKKRIKRYACSKMWVDFAYHCLQQNSKDKMLGTVYFPVKEINSDYSKATCYTPIIQLQQIVGMKFSLFHLPGTLKSLNDDYHFDYASKFETTYRMCLKSACHFLFTDENPVILNGLHFDHHLHLGRKIDYNRIIERLTYEFKDYASFNSGVYINDESSDHRLGESQSYDDCQFLQLTDLLVSGFRTFLGEATNSDHKEVCCNIDLLISKWNRGHAGYRNSRWYKGLSISQGSLDEESNWRFNNYIVPDTRKTNQFVLDL